MPEITKLEIGLEHLNCAIELYYSGQYHSSLHLAGAADELLGAYVRKHGGEPAFINMRNAIVRLTKRTGDESSGSSPKEVANLLNRAKNSVKHMSDETDDRVTHYEEEEARGRLEFALSNFYFLLAYEDIEETELISRFNADLFSV